MKKMKRFLAVCLALVMCLGMTVTAFAGQIDPSDSNPSPAPQAGIVVKDATKDAVYKAYKIFSATVSGTNMSYTVSDPAKDYMMGKAVENEIKTGDTVVFTLVTNGEITYVTVGDPQKAAEWVQANVAGLIGDSEPAATAPATQVGTTDNYEASIAIDEPGYYYVVSDKVDSESGNAVMLANLNSSVDIREKHGTPGFGDKGGKEADKKSVAIGEDITYTITYENALNYVNGDLVTKYTIEDVFPAGLELKADALVVKVNGTPVSFTNDGFTDGKKGINGEIEWATRTENSDGTHTDNTNYVAPATIEVTYTVTVTADIPTGNDGAKNTVKIGYNTTADEPETPPHTEEKEYTVYSAVLDIIKYDEENEDTKLEAEFILKYTEPDQEHQSYKGKFVVISNGVVSWADNNNGATVFTTNKNADGTEGVGYATIEGLPAGKYDLIEVKAPAGYTLLKDPKTVEFSTVESEKVEIIEGVETTIKSVTMTGEVEVPNKTGNLLPSTGGIGTTIFYVVGGVLVAGAGILLITKKRMSKEQ